MKWEERKYQRWKPKWVPQWIEKWSYIVMVVLFGVIFLVDQGEETLYGSALTQVTHRIQEWSLGQDWSDRLLTAWGVRDLPLAPGSAADEGATVDGADGDPLGDPMYDFSVVEQVELGVPEGSAPGEVMAEQPAVEPEPVTWRDPSEVQYQTVGDDYFADAVFIGDSRTVGMFEYGGLEEISNFYASTGMTVYKLFESAVVEVPGQRERETVEVALTEHSFAKIYLMIGINEMGTGTVESFIQKYTEVVAHLRELQPDAVIYLQGIMKVTTKRSEQGDYITNEGIEARNAEIAKLADNVKVYYLDVNPAICDESGGMVPSYTYDGVHLKAQYIAIWKEYLQSHAVENIP